MNIEEDPCTCGGPDYGVFGDANLCDYCRGNQTFARTHSKAAQRIIDEEKRRREARDRVSRDFNFYMIELFNQRNK